MTSDRVELIVDDQRMAARPADTIAAALVRSGRLSWRSDLAGAPRGMFCGIGTCFDCTLTVDGQPGVRACLTPVRPGMSVVTNAGPH